MPKVLMLTILTAGLTLAAEVPNTEISNGIIQARILLPDAEHGYYQGTRFDWSGVIASLKFKGHEYFGQWFEKYDPKTHDAIMGPVEEFRTNDAGLGYDEAKAGGTFIRIGVGGVRKPDEGKYATFKTYEIVNPGKWVVRNGPDRVEFEHTLRDESGYSYIYSKTVRLVGGKPQLLIEHALKNTGKRAIDTVQYNHNFFVIDGLPTGPDSVIKFPFDAIATADLKGLAKVSDRQLSYLKKLEKGQSLFTELKGYGQTAKDYDFRVENRKAGAGVRITGDRPLSKLVFWCIRTTACPEPYISMHIDPGKESKWKIRYEFYTLPAK